MTRRGPQASSPRILDFVPSIVSGDDAEVAQKMVPAGTVVR